jgi:uncharacterized protein YndB with AHSA1/START domain
MANHQVRVQEFFDAPPQKVFAVFADHAKLGRILGIPCKRIKDSNDPKNPNGLGSVRKLAFGLAAFEETITAFEPNKLIEYRVTRGSPIKNHLGHMEFELLNGGTRFDYTIDFDAKIPFTGGLIAFILKSGLTKGMRQVMKMV